MRRSAFQRDLNAIPADYREAVLNYLQRGTVPDNRLLLAILTGNYVYAIEEIDADLAAVIKFFKRHGPDFAFGSIEAVARWEFVQGTLSSAGMPTSGGEA